MSVVVQLSRWSGGFPEWRGMNKQGVGRWGSLVEKSTWRSEEVRRNYSAVTRITGITVLPSYPSWKRNRRKANLVIFEKRAGKVLICYTVKI